MNNLWVENITRSKAMREQISVFCAFDTSFEDINLLKLEMMNFVRDPANNRDFHPDVEVEVFSIAEMNKLELHVDIRHKSNWSNESLRASRRSKFMCALVLALRKVPIYGPGGSDATLGSQDKPSWSVAVPPDEAVAAYAKYKEKADAARLRPLNSANDEYNKGKSTGTDYPSVNVENGENYAINSLNNRRPGVDTVRDDTWGARDDASTIGGRRSTDTRPDLDEVRGLLRKASSVGRRKGGTTLSPYGSRVSVEQSRPPPLPLHVVPQSSNFGSPSQYVPPPNQAPQSQSFVATGSPILGSTGNADEHYQSLAPPPRSNSRPRAPQTEEEDEGERKWDPNAANKLNNPYQQKRD